MIASDHLRRQHREMLEIATQISSQLDAETLAANAVDVRNLLATLFGKLRVHLSMEDESLYPRLLAHADAGTQRVAQRLHREMGGLAEKLERYKTKWATAGTIQQAPQDFIRETNALFSALTKRIEKENDELYPLFDRNL